MLFFFVVVVVFCNQIPCTKVLFKQKDSADAETGFLQGHFQGVHAHSKVVYSDAIQYTVPRQNEDIKTSS